MGKKKKQELKELQAANAPPPDGHAVKMLGFVPDKILPEGWMAVNHTCGAIVYMHRETRVVTWSRPYAISRETSLKRHNVPLMSIPCLHQKSGMPGYEECIQPPPGEDEEPEQDGVETEEPSAKKMRLEDETAVTPSTENQSVPKADRDQSQINGPSEEMASQEKDTSSNKNEVNMTEENPKCPFSKTQTNDRTVVPEEEKDKIKPAGNGTENINLNTIQKSENAVCPVKNSSTETTSTNGEPMETVTECPYQSSNSNSPDASDESGEQNDDGKEQQNENSCPASPSNMDPDETDEKFVKDTNAIVVYKPNAVKSVCSKENEPGPNEIAPKTLRNYLKKIFEIERHQLGHRAQVLMSSDNFQEHYKTYDAEHHMKKFGTKNKTPFQVLNEYCQRTVKSLPHLRKLDRHSSHDFTVEIFIKNLKYGISVGDTLKEAKHNCAVCTLNIFDCSILGEEEPTGYLAVVDKMPANDKSVIPTIDEFVAIGGVKYPYEILVLLFDRNFEDFDESLIEFTTEPIEDGKYRYCLQYKEYKAEGETDHEKVKEVAAQALITVFYPDVKNWGSFVRLVDVHQELVDAKIQRTEAVPKLTRAGRGIITVLRQEMLKLAASH